MRRHTQLHHNELTSHQPIRDTSPNIHTTPLKLTFTHFVLINFIRLINMGTTIRIHQILTFHFAIQSKSRFRPLPLLTSTLPTFFHGLLKVPRSSPSSGLSMPCSHITSSTHLPVPAVSLHIRPLLRQYNKTKQILRLSRCIGGGKNRGILNFQCHLHLNALAVYTTSPPPKQQLYVSSFPLL
ncbi:hypothetical protein BLNAU_14712 [Blattamonas nauphoetae]|uniref:Uncharacterized protein n=1 Tax=Blattamonas nauphoetae TaxID=2049346 RepID=A0ABQ9XCZ6_9EUKA|nr:hypothetical protein BLNAU_14712 [Blattamonas nauphoetae]